MKIKVKLCGFENVNIYMHKFLEKQGVHKELFEIKKIFDMVEESYKKYCLQHFKQFVVRQGFGRDILIEVYALSTVRKEDHLANINSDQIIASVNEHTSPAYFQITVRTAALEKVIKSQFNELGDTRNFYYNLGISILNALVHETVHIAQCIHNQKLFVHHQDFTLAEKRLIELNIIYLIDFYKKISHILLKNKMFLNSTKLEGEATFFGLMQRLNLRGFIHILANLDPNSQISTRSDITLQDFKEHVDLSIKFIRKAIIQLKQINRLVSTNIRLQKGIFSLISDYNELTISTKSRARIENNLKKFNENTDAIDIKSISNLQDIIMYDIGYVIMYILTRSKQHRCNLTPETMIRLMLEDDKVKSESHSLKSLKKYFKQLLDLINETDENYVDMEDMISKEKKKLIYLEKMKKV